MGRDIGLLFYGHGGYESDSANSSQPNYLAYDDFTSSYVPMAVARLNSLCDVTKTVSYEEGNVTTGVVMDDLIVTELALSVADSEYDKLHVDPDTGQTENRHWDLAKRYMLDIYGVAFKGKLMLPKEAATGEEYKAAMTLQLATTSV